MPPIIVARQLGKTYRSGKIETHALRDATFSVDRGEFIAIVGPSGSGKSTLFYLLGGLTRATGGSVTIDGVDFNSLTDAERTRKRGEKIGFIFQRFNLLPTLTARGNIELAHKIAANDQPFDTGLLNRIAEMLRIEGRLDNRPNELSGGEQQRVAIARAMISKPAIILADEPTGNLDTENSDTVLEMLRHSSKVMGQTVLMITHNPEAAAIADRTLYVRDGRMHDAPPPMREPRKPLISSLLSE
jgi:putative ABC transport system ATP-binding protein